MCRLFGLHAGAAAVSATFWLLDAPDSLAAQSHRNPDGAGIGVFEADGTARVDKQPIAAWDDTDFASGARELAGTTFVAHVRHASTGEHTTANTHPFEQHGRLLAHNGIVGDVTELRRRLGGYAELVHGETDSEHFFALITKRIDEHGGDVGAGIAAAAREVAAEIPLYSLNIVLTTAAELWALRYPETNELWILERSIGLDPGIGFDERSASGTMRVQSRELSFLPATVIASERMDANSGWRLLEPGELVHVDPQLRVTSTIAVPDPPAHLIDLSKLSTREAIAQGEEPAPSVP